MFASLTHAHKCSCLALYSMSGVHVYQCPLCRTFSTSAYRLWLSHLGQVHRNDYSFRVMCGYHGCAETKNSYSSLYSHVYRRHPELIRKRCQATCGDEEHFPSTYETTDDTVDSELSGTCIISFYICRLLPSKTTPTVVSYSLILIPTS